MSTPARTDKDLARSAAGDWEAMDELIRRHRPRLVGFLRSLRVPEQDIDDAMQVVWVKVFKNVAKWDGNMTWVMKLARNVVIDDGRKKRRLTTTDNGVIELADPRRESDHDTLEKLAACLDALPEHVRGLLVAVSEGESYHDLATSLKIPLGTVQSRINRGRIDLKQCLGPYAE